MATVGHTNGSECVLCSSACTYEEYNYCSFSLNLAVSGGRRCRRRTLPYERVRSWRGADAWARRRRATPLRKSGSVVVPGTSMSGPADIR